jgi:hypothetical protein
MQQEVICLRGVLATMQLLGQLYATLTDLGNGLVMHPHLRKRFFESEGHTVASDTNSGNPAGTFGEVSMNFLKLLQQMRQDSEQAKKSVVSMAEATHDTMHAAMGEMLGKRHAQQMKGAVEVATGLLTKIRKAMRNAEKEVYNTFIMLFTEDEHEPWQHRSTASRAIDREVQVQKHCLRESLDAEWLGRQLRSCWVLAVAREVERRERLAEWLGRQLRSCFGCFGQDAHSGIGVGEDDDLFTYAFRYYDLLHTLKHPACPQYDREVRAWESAVEQQGQGGDDRTRFQLNHYFGQVELIKSRAQETEDGTDDSQEGGTDEERPTVVQQQAAAKQTTVKVNVRFLIERACREHGSHHVTVQRIDQMKNEVAGLSLDRSCQMAEDKQRDFLQVYIALVYIPRTI